MDRRFYFGATAIVVACFTLMLSCSDDEAGDDSSPGGTTSGGSAGSGMAGSGTSGAGMAGSATGGSEAGGGAPTGGLGFAEDIHPILRTMCSGCHDQDGSGLASFTFAVMDADEAYTSITSVAFTGEPLYTAIVQRIQRGEMPAGTGCDGNPPGSPGCVSQADFEKIQQWAQSGTPPPP